MTRFNPNADLVPIEQWEGIAEDKAIETGASWRILGGILAGGVGFALSIEVLGIVVGGYLCYSAYERIRRSGKDLRAVRDFGCVAQLLDEQEFRSFTKQFGDREVYQQITFALDRGWNVSKHALNWLDAHEKGKQLEPAGKQEKPVMTPTQEVQQLDRNFQASPQLEIPPVKTKVATYNPSDDSNIDIIGEMTNRIRNIFGVGQGGSGKGMLLANACRAVKAKHPDKKIFLINGKNDPKEHDYFAGCVDVEKRLHCETAKASTVAAWFEAAIAEYDEYATQNNGALLIVDEGTIIGSKLKDAKCNLLNDRMIGVTSGGGSNGKYMWVFCQTPFSGGSGSNQSALSQMDKIVLVRGDSLGVLDEWKYARMFRKFNPDDVANLASDSDCDRAVYWSGTAKWYSMPKLTNYSSFDRDTQTYIKDVPKSRIISDQVTTIQEDVTVQCNQELLDCILDKIADSEYIAFDTLRKHAQRQLPDIAKIESVREVINHLINEGLMQGNEKDGYQIN